MLYLTVFFLNSGNLYWITLKIKKRNYITISNNKLSIINYYNIKIFIKIFKIKKNPNQI